VSWQAATTFAVFAPSEALGPATSGNVELEPHLPMAMAPPVSRITNERSSDTGLLADWDHGGQIVCESEGELRSRSVFALGV
jgi:hypothetical protein